MKHCTELPVIACYNKQKKDTFWQAARRQKGVVSGIYKALIFYQFPKKGKQRF
jgi:hypothetical protein